MESPSKHGGAASPVCQGKEGASAVSQYSLTDKIVSPRFCDHVLQIKTDSSHVSFAEFIDRSNLRWHCFRPLTCDHAIMIGGSMVSCRVRTAMLKGSEKELGFV
jgi:hypothetical protein